MKDKIINFKYVLLILLCACSNPMKDENEGIAAFSITVRATSKATNLADVLADTLTAVRIRIFKDSIRVKTEEAKLVSGIFNVETVLNVGKGYSASAEAFINNLPPAAFIGNSGLFEIIEDEVTIVDIALVSTAISVQILSPTDTLKNDTTLSLQLVALFPNTARRDVTYSSLWSINPGTAASIDSSGKVTPFPNRVGTEMVKAIYRGLSDTLTLYIVFP